MWNIETNVKNKKLGVKKPRKIKNIWVLRNPLKFELNRHVKK